MDTHNTVSLIRYTLSIVPTRALQLICMYMDRVFDVYACAYLGHVCMHMFTTCMHIHDLGNLHICMNIIRKSVHALG